MSADDLRINLWHLEVTNQCFSIVDMKPLDMEDLVGDLVFYSEELKCYMHEWRKKALTLNRAVLHGVVDCSTRGDHFGRVPPVVLQPVGVRQLERLRPAG